VKRFVEGRDRRQGVLLPEYLDDYVSEENPVRVVEAFIDELDLEALGFAGVAPEPTGRPAYHPAVLLKIYLYGYLNQVQSSRRLEKMKIAIARVRVIEGRLKSLLALPLPNHMICWPSARVGSLQNNESLGWSSLSRLDAQISGDRQSQALAARQAYLDGELCGVGPDGVTSFNIVQLASDSGNAAALARSPMENADDNRFPI
jgi:Transposase domain (DUF772)